MLFKIKQADSILQRFSDSPGSGSSTLKKIVDKRNTTNNSEFLPDHGTFEHHLRKEFQSGLDLYSKKCNNSPHNNGYDSAVWIGATLPNYFTDQNLWK